MNRTQTQGGAGRRRKEEGARKVWGWGVGATEIGAVGAGAGRRSRRIVDGGTGGRMDGDTGAAARRKEPPEAGPGNKSTPGVSYRGHGGRRQTQRPRVVPQGNGDRDLDAGSGRGDHASRGATVAGDERVPPDRMPRAVCGPCFSQPCRPGTSLY